ncbi:MAG: formamidopyrimidine-DNA glycosylase [Alphaproteobacteria bacterium]|nr:formamidopyrimidine-DNA glycosylase [Alphaproteobacteria bacterium]
MPELPDITVYIEALDRRITGVPLEGVRLASPFLLRTVEPPLSALTGRRVKELRRIGKRIAFGFEDDLWLVLHLMIAGRLQWKAAGAAIPGGKRGLAAFDFADGTLILTEAGSKKRASLYVVAGAAGLAAHDPGGLELFEASLGEFAARLTRSNHTLKRALTDPRLFSGIGNAYSDEILLHARLSPVAMTQKLEADEIARLFEVSKSTLCDWCDRLRGETGAGFPEKVTAFRPEMGAHGKYGERCPVCGTKIQRIRYATNETNYCPQCQTGGRLLADRALSRLLKKDWPRRPEELEELRGAAK